MKKAVLFVAALVLIAAVAFAQDAGVKIGGWGRGIFVVAGGGDDIVVGDIKTWSTNEYPRIGINIIGTSANVGFQIDVNADGNIGLGDQVKIWVKPIDMVLVQLGVNCYYDALRGSASFGAYNWLRFTGMPGDGAIFQRVSAAGADYDGSNFQVIVTPVEGFVAYASLDGIAAPAGTGVVIEDALKIGSVYGAGYTIAGIGTVRAQYLGLSADDGAIEAAFKVSAVPGLNLDLGAQIPTDMEARNLVATLFASYAAMPTLTVNAIARLVMQPADLDADDDDLGIYGGIGVDYGLEGGYTVTADFRYDSTDMADADATIGFLVAFQKNFSNGIIGIGFEGTTANFAYNGWAGNTPLVDKGTEPDALVWAIPIRLEFWF